MMSSSDLHNAHTDFSYATLVNPSITSLGVAVAGLALTKLDGNFMLATSMVKNPELMKAITNEPAPPIQIEGRGVMGLINGSEV
jgi:hypothetical protein